MLHLETFSRNMCMALPARCQKMANTIMRLSSNGSDQCTKVFTQYFRSMQLVYNRDHGKSHFWDVLTSQALEKLPSSEISYLPFFRTVKFSAGFLLKPSAPVLCHAYRPQRTKRRNIWPSFVFLTHLHFQSSWLKTVVGHIIDIAYLRSWVKVIGFAHFTHVLWVAR